MKMKQYSERPSPRSSVQKLIADGKRTDKLNVSNLPLHKRKVSEKNIKSHTAYEYTRNGLVSASGGSNQFRSKYTNKSKEHTAVLNMIQLFGNKQIRSSHLTKPCCCNHCSHSSIIKRHPSVCQHCIRQLNVEKCIKSRRKRFGSKMCAAAIRGIRFNPKNVSSAPYLSCLCKTFMIHSSNALATFGLNKAYSGSKSRYKKESYETDNENVFVVSSVNGCFNHRSPHQRVVKIYEIQNKQKEEHGIPMFKNKVDYFSFQDQHQSNRGNKTQIKLVGLKPYVDKTNQHLFSFNGGKSICALRERNLCNSKKKIRALYSLQSDQDKRLINTTDILRKPILDVISQNKTPLFESKILNKKRRRKDMHAKSSVIYIDKMHRNTNPNNVSFIRTITAFPKTNKNRICVDSKRKSSRGDHFYKKQKNTKIDQNCYVFNTGTKSLFELFRPDHKCSKTVSKNRNIEPHMKMCKCTSLYCVPDTYDSYFCFKKNQRNRYRNKYFSIVKKKRKSIKSMISIHCKSRSTQSRDKMNEKRTKSECPSLETDLILSNFCFGTDYCKNLSTLMLRSRDLSIKYQTVSDLTSAKKRKQNDMKRYISDGRILQVNNTDEDTNRPSSYSDCISKMLIRSNKIKNVQKYDFQNTCPCHAIEKKKYNKPVSKFTKKCQCGNENDYAIKFILKQATKKGGQHKIIGLHNDMIKFSPNELNVNKKRRTVIQKHERTASTSFITKSAYHLKNSNKLTSNSRHIIHNKYQVRDSVSNNQRKVSDQIAALRDCVCKSGFWVPYECNQNKCTKRRKTRFISPLESKDNIIRKTRMVRSTKESFQKRKLVSHKYAQTDNSIELKVFRAPKGVTRSEVFKPGKQKSMRSIYSTPQYKSMYAVYNLGMKTSKSNYKKHESKNTCRLYEDNTKDKYKSNRKGSDTLTLKSTLKNYDVYSKPEMVKSKKKRSILHDNPHGSKLYNSGSRGRMRNTLSKLLSISADAYRLRKFLNVRTNRAARVARSHTVPKVPVENVLKNPRTSRRVYTIGSNINLSIQFYKENSLGLDHIASSPKKGPAVSRSTSSSPYGNHSVRSGLLKKLKSLYTSQVTNKSKNTRLYDKNNKTRKEIVKQEIVKSIPNHEFLANEHIISHRNSLKYKSKRNRRIHQSSHKNTIKKQMSKNIMPKYQLPKEDNSASQSKDTKSKSHYSRRAIREEIVKKQIVNNIIFKNKVSVKENTTSIFKDEKSKNYHSYGSGNENIMKQMESTNMTKKNFFNIDSKYPHKFLHDNSNLPTLKRRNREFLFRKAIRSECAKSRFKRRNKECNKQGVCTCNESNKERYNDDDGNSKYTSTLPVKSIASYNKSTLTKLKQVAKNVYECEPHVCIPGVCEPNVCFKIYKSKRKTVKDMSILAKKQEKSKSVATNPFEQDTFNAKRYFCILMNKKVKNIEVPEKLSDNSIKDISHPSITIQEEKPNKKVVLAKPYEKINKQSKRKNFICKCFGKFGLINAEKESRIALLRKPAVYKRGKLHKNVSKKSYKAHFKAKQDLVTHNYGNIETLMPYSKKKFKKSKSKMTFVGFYESKKQELVNEMSISGPKRHEYRKIKEQNTTASQIHLKLSDNSIKDISHPSITIQEEKPNKKAVFANPYEKINKPSKRKNFICKCFGKFGLINAEKESRIALLRKPAVYKRGKLHKNVSKKSYKAHFNAKQDLVTHNYGNIETLMPYSKKKFKKSKSKMTIIGFYESKKQELVTEMSISEPKRHEYRKIKERNTTASQEFIHLNEPNRGKYKKRSKQQTTAKQYISATEISISRPNTDKYRKKREQNATSSEVRLRDPKIDKNKYSKEQYFPSSEIILSQPRGKYKKSLKQNVPNKIEKQYIPQTKIPISRPKKNKYKKIKEQSATASELILARRNRSKYKKRKKQDVSIGEVSLSYPIRRSNRKKEKQDILVTKITVDRQNTEKSRKQRITSSEILLNYSKRSIQKKNIKKDGPARNSDNSVSIVNKEKYKKIIQQDIPPQIFFSHPNRSKYKKRNDDNYSNSVHANIRKQKSKSSWEIRKQGSFDDDNTPKYRVTEKNSVDSKSPDTPVISKYVQHVNAITKCLKTAIFNLPLGLPKKLKRFISDQYKHLKAEDTEPKAQQRLSKRHKYEEINKKDICPICERQRLLSGHYRHKQEENKQLDTQQAHAVTTSCKICCKENPSKLKSASTATRFACLCPQGIFDNHECFKIPDKQNSTYVDEFCCNKSLNQSKRLGNHFKQIKLKNTKVTTLQTASDLYQTPDMPLTDVKRSENIKIFKSYPCCGRDHNQPELSIPLRKSVPGFFKSLYRKKRKLTLPKQNCIICFKSNLVETPPADFCTNKCYISGASESVESEGKIKKQKEIEIQRDKLRPLFDMVVDADTMKVINKYEMYRNLRGNFHAEKQDPKRSQKKQVLPPAIDLVMNRDDSVLLNGDYMLRALGTNRKRMTKPTLTMKTNISSMSQPCSRNLLGEKPPIKVVKSDQPKSHPEYCTCCICSNIPKVRRQNHPENCICCICRYGCRYGVKIRTKENELRHNKNDEKLKLGEKATGNDILHATVSEISSLVGNVKKVSGYVTGFVSDVESIISQLRVKPCSCGLRICKKETKKLEELRLRGLKANVPPECVCGSKVCKRKYTKKIPYYKDKEIIKKKKAIEKKKREKRLRKETIARLKRYSKENASMRKRIKRQDKKAMKTIEKYKDYTSSWVMLAENAADVGRFGINTFYRMITSFKRIICHPRDIKYRAKLACADPTGTAAKSLQEFHDSGYSGTLARVRHRCATMQTSKYLISAMESHPVTNYLLHFRDKDPKQRLLKQMPMKEEPDIESNAFFNSLRKKPCLWLYRLCPSFYPHCLSLLNFWRQFTDVILFLIAVAVWSPCILCTEFCRTVMCCFMCAGGG